MPLPKLLLRLPLPTTTVVCFTWYSTGHLVRQRPIVHLQDMKILLRGVGDISQLFIGLPPTNHRPDGAGKPRPGGCSTLCHHRPPGLPGPLTSPGLKMPTTLWFALSWVCPPSWHLMVSTPTPSSKLKRRMWQFPLFKGSSDVPTESGAKSGQQSVRLLLWIHMSLFNCDSVMVFYICVCSLSFCSLFLAGHVCSRGCGWLVAVDERHLHLYSAHQSDNNSLVRRHYSVSVILSHLVIQCASLLYQP